MDFLRDATEILMVGTNDPYYRVHAILEDAESPVTRKSIETIFQSVIDKKHVDFDTIPKSKGDIRNYSGYESMVSVLAAIKSAATDKTYAAILSYVNIVQDAINNLVAMSTLYQQGFSKREEMVMLEYNTFVFTCVEATTSILYQFVDYIKTPSTATLVPAFKNTNYRADLFYIEQLQKYNAVCKSGNYKKYLQQMIRNGKDNFLGVDDGLAIGIVAVTSVVALSIVPVTRKLVYTFQDMRGRIAEDLELQAYFLELNKATLEANTTRDAEKNKKIIEKQEKTRLKFLRLADKLRVKSVRAEELAQKNIDNENRGISIDSMHSDVDDNDFSIM